MWQVLPHNVSGWQLISWPRLEATLVVFSVHTIFLHFTLILLVNLVKLYNISQMGFVNTYMYKFMNSKSLVNCFVWNHQHFEKFAKTLLFFFFFFFGGGTIFTIGYEFYVHHVPPCNDCSLLTLNLPFNLILKRQTFDIIAWRQTISLIVPDHLFFKFPATQLDTKSALKAHTQKKKNQDSKNTCSSATAL